jgi:ribosomal protein S18 acetylase RimI-like enzyme
MIMSRDLAKWERLTAADICGVDRLAQEIHADFPERMDVFAEKIRLFPEGCWKRVRQGRIIGYGIAHPWELFCIPPLDQFLNHLPTKADCFYIHDVALLPDARGEGAADQYVKIIREAARKSQISKLALVSVYGTDIFWKKMGFQIFSADAIFGKLSAYGETAKYMISDLDR